MSFPWEQGELVVVALVVAWLITSFSCISMAVYVYVPRYPPATGNLLYFEDIRRMTRSEFVERSQALTDDQIESLLLDQVYRVSDIASIKFRYVRRAFILSGPAFLAWLSSMILISFD